MSTLQVYSVVEILVSSTYMDTYKSSSYNNLLSRSAIRYNSITLDNIVLLQISYVCVTVVNKALLYLANTVVNIPWLFLLERMKIESFRE